MPTTGIEMYTCIPFLEEKIEKLEEKNKEQQEKINKIKLIIKGTAYGGNEDYYIGKMKEILSILEDKVIKK